MASEIHMERPMCLIENAQGQLEVNPEALEILFNIMQTVVVVAIAGQYRTGKSHLMNKLTGKKKGFSLGATVQSHTKGIWMWCVPHPKKSKHTLVLLDTESLGDVEKGNKDNDSWILALAILLSSTFVYNSIGTITQDAMDHLQYPFMLRDRIRAKSSPNENEVEDSADFIGFFPEFVWTLRDVTLKLKADKQALSADEYLQNSLKLKPGASKKDENYNLPRLCIRKFFPNKKCFIFYPLTDWKKLARLETLHDDELNSDFAKQVKEFCSHIFSHSKIKTLPGGIRVNGPRLQNLVLTYVNAIKSGDLPCLENAVLALAQIENSAAVQKALTHYDQQMDQKLQLPTETLQELLDLHMASERQATEVFIGSSFKDIGQKFQRELAAYVEPHLFHMQPLFQPESAKYASKSPAQKKRDDFCKQNEKASSDRCSALLQEIFKPLEEEVKEGIYSKPGGYQLFIQKIEDLKKKYSQEQRKGIQAEEILQTYLKSKEAVRDAILQTDLSVSEKEKEIEAERVKAEAAEAAAKMVEEMQKKKEQMMEQKEKSYQEHIKQLTEKIQIERQQLLMEQELVLALKLQKQALQIKQGYQTENARIRDEIQNLNKKIGESRGGCNII
ncbi:guanylate-binding protein 1-like [Carlito syrichta]|uniref:Guanylate-binding protein 1-like n=1 Tax=Carlito syrichta TaxID=1868482 RepID=A0A3Q0E4V2_CARSF|nr:guanylate-binding protein 1-like [Carlito syrichta]